MRTLKLSNFQSPGDVLMLTAAVRDLHRSQPGKFTVTVRTSVPDLWENNPFLENATDSDADFEEIRCEYPLINDSNRLPGHFLTAFPKFLSDRLGFRVELTDFKGDVHLSEAEQCSKPRMLSDIVRRNYWLISAGGKRDFTIKWWDRKRYQDVVNHFRGRVTFVQVGAEGDFHPKLDGTVDLRGRTTVRELVHLVHHSAGVVSPVSFLMHLSAAVPVGDSQKSLGSKSRPCVVIAGGREPPHWEAYPTHQFLHTVGALVCCSAGGCWRSRTKILGDGSEHDSQRRVCVNVVNHLPRCMDMITAADVIQRIELYLDGCHNRPPQLKRVLKAFEAASKEPNSKKADGWLNALSAPAMIDDAILRTPDFPEGRFNGRGIVIAAGGPTYLACAWVCIAMLRKADCQLPIEIWHFGEEEVPGYLQPLFDRFNVKFKDATRERRKIPARHLDGWPLKAYAILNSRFKEVILLDADNVPLVNPRTMFDTPEYARTGAIFWPDLGRIGAQSPLWEICGVEYQNEPEFESGQIVVDKQRCWRALSLALWMNEHADFFYLHMHGDKETFHLAFRRLGHEYSMPGTPPRVIKGTLLQHDFRGNVIFQHRGTAKWSCSDANVRVPGFAHEDACLEFLEALATTPEWQRFTEKPERVVLGPKQTFERSLSKAGFYLRAPVNSSTGYGLHSCQIVSDFLDMGVAVSLVPTALGETFAALPRVVKECLASSAKTLGNLELLLHPPFAELLPGKQCVYFTMWETTLLPRSSVDLLNRARCVVVPCRWNLETFRNSGVTAPIYVVPLGINADTFAFSPMKLNGPCVFGAAAKLKDSDPSRKRIDTVIEAFLLAFPSETDVQLRIKVFPDCELDVPSDERVQIVAQYLSEAGMANWFAGLTCFVSASAAEGWGLMQQQALSVGRPVITTFFGGVTEFVTADNSYIVPHIEVPATGRFAGMGRWAQADKGVLIENMQRVYRDRSEASKKGLVGSGDVRHLTWKRSNAALASILDDIQCSLKAAPLVGAMDNEVPPETPLKAG